MADFKKSWVWCVNMDVKEIGSIYRTTPMRISEWQIYPLITKKGLIMISSAKAYSFATKWRCCLSIRSMWCLGMMIVTILMDIAHLVFTPLQHEKEVNLRNGEKVIRQIIRHEWLSFSREKRTRCYLFWQSNILIEL